MSNYGWKHCILLCFYVRKPLKSIWRTLTINSPWLTFQNYRISNVIIPLKVYTRPYLKMHHWIFPRLCKTNLIMIYFEPKQISATQHFIDLSNFCNFIGVSNFWKMPKMAILLPLQFSHHLPAQNQSRINDPRIRLKANFKNFYFNTNCQMSIAFPAWFFFLFF